MPSAARIAAFVAIVLGVALFVLTISRLDLQEMLQYTRRLGLALPVLLLPSVAWHLLRTWGWAVSFPDRALPARSQPVRPAPVVPSFWHLFRVRLAADAISFFTVRGPTGEPLKVLLLSDQVPPAVSAASITAERVAFALVSVIVAGAVSQVAVRRMSLPPGWDATFTLLSIGAVLLIGVFALVVRHGTGNYLGRLLSARSASDTGAPRRSIVVRFLLEVERNLLAVLRGKRQRLATLTVLPVVCYGLNALEVWAIFAAIGEPIGAEEALVIETFVRLASVAGAAVPASLGTLEASHIAIATALGLSGGGGLALARRLRALLWASLGLALYPRLGKTRPAMPSEAPPRTGEKI
jgi:hypothetical protein